jgi:hypothetical protein
MIAWTPNQVNLIRKVYLRWVSTKRIEKNVYFCYKHFCRNYKAVFTRNRSFWRGPRTVLKKAWLRAVPSERALASFSNNKNLKNYGEFWGRGRKFLLSNQRDFVTEWIFFVPKQINSLNTLAWGYSIRGEIRAQQGTIRAKHFCGTVKTKNI